MAATTTTFHRRTGSLVSLSNSNKTAQRNHPAQEFNNGVVLSEEPLRDNQLFEVKIDRKVNSWSGSIEVGLTTSDPSNLNFPTSATGFREGTWVMSGCSVLKDGHTTLEEYGQDLDQLAEGDRVGVLRTTAGALHFYVNGIDQGPAATGIPSPVYGVIDMYGKCAQVTIVDDVYRDMVICNDITNEAIVEASLAHSNERLVFHEHCGTLVKLTNGRRTAERRRPLDEFNNGVVMTNRPLKNDELFEIRLDRLVDKWSGSIEVGITTHNPSRLDFPATMTNMRSGTVMMSGCGILTNGKGTRREYGEYNLDELQEGDRIGLIRKSSGALHYYINGQDQGVAATRTPEVVWGVVDLYGMAVKVTILDCTDPHYPGFNESDSVTTRVNNYFKQFNRDVPEEEEEDDNSSEEAEKLMFHTLCGSHAAVINNQRTAHRPNALDDFNNGVILTSRTLRQGEVFEVRLDKMVDKWAGSIEIGVTTHSPAELDFPSTMTNIRSGTWMMTGNGVMHNGTTVIDDYGRNLDQLKEGDRVGVVRRSDGSLQFFVNGLDQGTAASNVPVAVYGVIDLYGQAAQASIVDQSDPHSLCDVETVIEANPEELRFHSMHGRNATISTNGKTASRPNARGEFNDAIIMSSRPLRDNEIFEVNIDTMVDRWSGSIEAGVTSILPEDLDFPNTMTDIDYDTWMLSGSAIMQDGSTVRNGYRLDLDSLVVGSRIGMVRCSDGTLHFYLNGEDQGVACTDLPPGVFAVIDLYGQCAQVTLTSGSVLRSLDNQVSPKEIEQSLSSPVSVDISHRFSMCCGKNISIKNNGCTASRVRGENHGLLFSVDPLRAEELFEVKIDQLANQWAGSLQIGLTTMAISDNLPLSILPSTASDLRSKVTWVVSGSEVSKNGVIVKENFGPSLERLQVDDRVGIKRCADGSMRIYINGADLGVAATGIPKNTFALVDLYGKVEQVTITSSAFAEILNSSRPPSIPLSDSSDSIEDEQDRDTAEPCYLELHSNHGKNIRLSERHLVACRTASYNQGIVISHKALPKNHIFNIRLDKLNSRWTSSLLIGVVGFPPDKSTLPVSALNIKKSSWIVYGDSVFQSGIKVKEHYGPNLNSLQAGHLIGVMIDDDSALHMYINGVDQGVAARDIPHTCYALVDVYGQCEQITVVTDRETTETVTQGVEYKEKAVMEDGVKEKIHRCIDPVVKNCEFQNMCSRFKANLGLPEGYFNSENNRCYCETCHKVRGDEPYFKVGEPPMDYALPFGWCKFGLRVPPKAELSQVLEKWHIAYHGGKVSTVRKVLDSGDLLSPASSLSMIGPPSDGKNRPEEILEVKPTSMSPSVRYAACLLYAPRYEFRDPKTKKTQYARVSFQVRVKPGSYRVGAQSIGANEQIDPKFHNNEVEWLSRDRNSIVLTSLLFKIEQ